MRKIITFAVLMLLIGKYADRAECKEIRILNGPSIVSARVVEVTLDKEKYIKAKLTITEVFWGKEHLIGREFFTISTKDDIYSNGLISPKPSLGEEGIWAINEMKSIIRIYRYPIKRIELPSRSGISRRYEAIKRWAASLKMFKECDPKKEIEMLTEFTYDKCPEVSIWGIYLLWELLSPDNRDIVTNMLESDRTVISTQIAIDDVFSRDVKKWKDSIKRKGIIQGWFKRKNSAYIQEAIVNKIMQMVYNRTMSDKYLLEILFGGIRSGLVTTTNKSRMIGYVGIIAGRIPNDSNCFEFLVKFLKSNNRLLRISAASALAYNVKFDGNRKELIIEHLKTETDMEVITRLRKIIGKEK